jgi:hypothetical protein
METAFTEERRRGRDANTKQYFVHVTMFNDFCHGGDLDGPTIQIYPSAGKLHGDGEFPMACDRGSVVIVANVFDPERPETDHMVACAERHDPE